MTGHTVVLTQNPLQAFIAAGLGQLLVDVCSAQQGALVVPQTVVDQIRRAGGVFSVCESTMISLEQVGDLAILDDDLHDSSLLAAYQRVEKGVPVLRRDGVVDTSPVVALAHAYSRTVQAEDARLLTDSWVQRGYAETHDVDVLESAGILLAGARHHIIESPAKARSIYGRLQEFNPDLSRWNPVGPLSDPAEYR